MKKVRFGVVGVGGMGRSHSRACAQHASRDLCLGAVCDTVEATARERGEELDVPYFTDAQEMFDSGLIDAVIVATPHYWHPPLTIRAARTGLHVLCEKPLASTVGAARAMLAECKKHKVALGAMLQQRTRSEMIKAKQLIDSGQLGEIFRVQFICSSWFRTQKYYDSGAWRGTWDGEGGGVLINQAPHTLDMFQWLGGMPKRVLAIINTRAHNIEVEDTANIICEYGRGKIGYLYATTAEQPGYDQIILSGDKATMVIENGKIRVGKLKKPLRKYIMQSKSAFAGKKDQKTTWRDVKCPEKKSGHAVVIRAFARHILRGGPMVATGAEAINELELSNAAYISGFKNKAVDLPVDAAEMDRLLAKLVRERSKGRGGGMIVKARRELNRLLRKKR